MPLLLLIAAALLWLSFKGSQSGGGAVPGAPADTGAGDDAGSDASVPGIDDFTEAWARFEGYFTPGSLAQRSNNPGAIKGNWQGVVGQSSSGIDIFDNEGDGWAAAEQYEQQQAAQHPGWSIQNFFAKVLGDLSGTPVNNDQGNSDSEADYVAGRLGLPASTALSSLLEMSDG